MRRLFGFGLAALCFSCAEEPAAQDPPNGGHEPFSCPASGFEPNDARETAATLEPATCVGLQLASQDQDWYRLEIPPGTLATVGISFRHVDGDLDLLAYDADGTFLGARYMDETYSGYYRTNETDKEVLSVLAGTAGSRSALFRVRGQNSAVNVYELHARFLPFEDGPLCADIPALAASCETLQQFPFPDANDGFIGDGYNFDTSDWFYAFFVFANYRWLKLKVILAVRHAIHAVQQRFPGTKPLSLGDMSQEDGRTPGWDSGELRHPDGAHDDGLAIDLAYYQKMPSNDLQWVCDADLDLYDGGEFCPAGLQHVVDLERTAYFLLTLAEHPDFDVVGIDPAVKQELLAEADRQANIEGWFAPATFTRLRGRVASGAGWPYHFDHMHVWFD